MVSCCFRYHKGTDFQANHNRCETGSTKVALFQIPQRYRFSSKSQHRIFLNAGSLVVLDTTKVQIFKQITTKRFWCWFRLCCFRYHKGTDFQANHNEMGTNTQEALVVLDTTKVQIFKQITTQQQALADSELLFQIPQRYRFSSKSQQYFRHSFIFKCCFRYHKGTDFQANHNEMGTNTQEALVVLDTTKVQIFKQITTQQQALADSELLFQIPQRYRFSSKSQQYFRHSFIFKCCFRYHKGTDFQANHNELTSQYLNSCVVLDTTKVQIFKQITTIIQTQQRTKPLFQIPQRYRFSSKSQRFFVISFFVSVVLDTTKVQIFKQITTCYWFNRVVTWLFQIPQRYRFSSKSQQAIRSILFQPVVLDTTKVQIFKQITTPRIALLGILKLFQIPQRYRFSSKSQPALLWAESSEGCFRYHKGTDFQANHNNQWLSKLK